MAYRPSLRRTRVSIQDLEPNLTPIMNLMVVLIPLLLTSAQLIKISVIELNLPPAAGPEITEEAPPKEEDLRLELAVTITDKGFILSSPADILGSDSGPSIPKLDGEYDYELLAQTLYKIKQKAFGKYEDTDSIIIQAESDVDYQTLVSTMDAARAIRMDDKLVSLFPQVSISAFIL